MWIPHKSLEVYLRMHITKKTMNILKNLFKWIKKEIIEDTINLEIGDIVTFDYSTRYKDVKAIYKGEFKYYDNIKQFSGYPILELLEDISYTSTHHCGETFAKGSEIDFINYSRIKTINGKKLSEKDLTMFN